MYGGDEEISVGQTQKAQAAPFGVLASLLVKPVVLSYLLSTVAGGMIAVVQPGCFELHALVHLHITVRRELTLVQKAVGVWIEL